MACIVQVVSQLGGNSAACPVTKYLYKKLAAKLPGSVQRKTFYYCDKGAVTLHCLQSSHVWAV